jgi:hypothetical protein
VILATVMQGKKEFYMEIAYKNFCIKTTDGTG